VKRETSMSTGDTPRPDHAARPAGSAALALHTTVEVIHAYYADPSRCRLRFEPSPEARDWLSRSGAVVRASPNTWQLYASAALGPAVLDISVFAQDTEFSRCTDGPSASGLPPARVDSANARFDATAGVWVLGEPGVLPGVGRPKHASVQTPAFVLTLRLAGSPSDAARHYRVALAARRTVWKYLLFGSWAAERPYVVDLDGAVDFEPATPEPVAGGELALAIRSIVPLALQERSTRRFQLRGRSDHPDEADRVLVHHLPAANAVQFDHDTRGDPPALVSEIYVRR
jgi:hypothetical protein